MQTTDATPIYKAETAFIKFFSTSDRGLFSFHEDGSAWQHPIDGQPQFQRELSCAGDFDIWKKRITSHAATLPTWAREMEALPSMSELEEWTCDSVCETPSGDQVEPDGHGPDGAPSWLLLLGLI